MFKKVRTPKQTQSPIETKEASVQEARSNFEAQRMSRRKALRQMGITTGVAVFGMLSVDDLARIAAAKLKENKVTQGIGDSIAKEFRGAGVAFAAGTTPSNPNPPGQPSKGHLMSDDVELCCVGLNPNSNDTSPSTNCQQCANALGADASIQNVLAAMAQAGCPGDVTMVTSRAAQCNMDVEESCNANPSGSIAMQDYLACLINGTLDDYETGLVYQHLVGLLH